MPQPEGPSTPGALEGESAVLGLLYFPYFRGLAHELNNPLTGILGYAQLLALGAGGVEGAAEELQEIEGGAVRCRDLVALLSRCSRVEEGLVPYDPVQLFEDVVALVGPLAHRRSVRLEVRRADGLPHLRGRPWILRAALLGLVGLGLPDPAPEPSRMLLGLRPWEQGARVRVGFPGRSLGWLEGALASEGSADPRFPAAAGAARRTLLALRQGFETEEGPDGAGLVVSLR